MGQTLVLSLSLAKTNFKLRNEGSYLGFIWYILSPLALFFIILFVKNQAFNGSLSPSVLRGTMANLTNYYPVYLLVGLLLFNLFAQTVSVSMDVIRSNANFVKSIKIPLESLVLAKVFQFLFSHIFEILLLVVCLMYLGISLVGLLPYLVVLILFLFFVAGICFLFSTLGVFVNDLNNVWLAVSQLLFFITPIFYIPVEGTLLYKINMYNPLFYFMQSARGVLLGVDVSNFIWMIATLISLVTFSVGFLIFRKFKPRFAEFV